MPFFLNLCWASEALKYIVKASVAKSISVFEEDLCMHMSGCTCVCVSEKEKDRDQRPYAR